MGLVDVKKIEVVVPPRVDECKGGNGVDDVEKEKAKDEVRHPYLRREAPPVITCHKDICSSSRLARVFLLLGRFGPRLSRTQLVDRRVSAQRCKTLIYSIFKKAKEVKSLFESYTAEGRGSSKTD